jgi:diguanylate cyclase
MQDDEATVGTLQALKDLGVMLAIDDFGTGDSSFTCLRRFPVDELKLDQFLYRISLKNRGMRPSLAP